MKKKNNIFVRNAVKQLEWRLTDTLRNQLHISCCYDWKTSPKRALWGKSSKFVCHVAKGNEQIGADDWDGDLSIRGDGKLKITLTRVINTPLKKVTQKIELF